MAPICFERHRSRLALLGHALAPSGNAISLDQNILSLARGPQPTPGSYRLQGTTCGSPARAQCRRDNRRSKTLSGPREARARRASAIGPSVRIGGAKSVESEF